MPPSPTTSTRIAPSPDVSTSRPGATVARVERTASALATLLSDALARHRRLAAEAGVAHMIRQDGLLCAYPDRAAFQAEALAWRLRRENGVRWTELDEGRLHDVAPALAGRHRFGALVAERGHCTDPGGYVAILIPHMSSGGGGPGAGRSARF